MNALSLSHVTQRQQHQLVVHQQGVPRERGGRQKNVRLEGLSR